MISMLIIMMMLNERAEALRRSRRSQFFGSGISDAVLNKNPTKRKWLSPTLGITQRRSLNGAGHFRGGIGETATLRRRTGGKCE